MAHVQIQIVGWNHKRYLTRLFESLRAQTFKDIQVIYIDNASNDHSLDLVREKFPEVVTLKNTNNLGVTGAHNQGFLLALSKWPVAEFSERFVLVLSPDMMLTPNFVEELVRAAENHPKAGVFGGKLLKVFDTEGLDRELEQLDRSEILDSTGIIKQPNGRFVDRGEGEEDRGQYAAGDVWGVSGAAMLLRASALETVREDGAVFDADFFAFKEDIDLAWRLQRAGWSAEYVPAAVAYHYRGAFSTKRETWWEKRKHRKQHSSLANEFSHRNTLLLFVKNLSFREFFFHSFRLIPRFIGACVSTAVLEPAIAWKTFWSFLRLFPRTVKKRGMIRKMLD